MHHLLFDAKKQSIAVGDRQPCASLAGVMGYKTPVPAVAQTPALHNVKGKAKAKTPKTYRNTKRPKQPAKKRENTKVVTDKFKIIHFNGKRGKGMTVGVVYEQFTNKKLCANCGKPFTPKRSDAMFCSGACRVAAHRGNKQGRLI